MVDITDPYVSVPNISDWVDITDSCVSLPVVDYGRVTPRASADGAQGAKGVRKAFDLKMLAERAVLMVPFPPTGLFFPIGLAAPMLMPEFKASTDHLFQRLRAGKSDSGGPTGVGPSRKPERLRRTL